MADLDKKILSCQVIIETYTNIRQQVNVILLVVGQLVFKSCKMPNDHLFKKRKQSSSDFLQQ